MLKILWICSVWPDETASAASKRTLQLISISRKKGHTVSVISPASQPTENNHLTTLGVTTHQFDPNNPLFDSFLTSYHPDIVVFDRFMMEEQFSWRVHRNLPQALRVLDSIDLHHIRTERAREFFPNDKASLFGNNDKFRELSSIFRSDITLLVSPTEYHYLHETVGVPSSLLSVCPLYATPLTQSPSFHERQHFVTIGTGLHKPNIDSLDQLLTTLWPSIYERLNRSEDPPPELHIYGASLPDSLTRKSKTPPGVHILGWTPNALTTLSRYRVLLAPLRFGAGIKGKILDSWCSGTPVVTTSVGIEGMIGEEPCGGIVDDSPEGFISAAVALYNDEESWHRYQQNGFHLVQTRYNERHIEEIFHAAIHKALVEKVSRREANVVGSMLWYNYNRATEFFSRWIELKSKQTK